MNMLRVASELPTVLDIVDYLTMVSSTDWLELRWLASIEVRVIQIAAIFGTGSCNS
jgi:hypothetical protein